MPEIRTARLEDWEGNQYVFGGGGGGQGGVDTGASDIVQDKDSTTDGTLIDDTSSNNGSSIIINSNTGNTTNAATVGFADLPFGYYSVNLRVKTSRNNTANNLLLVTTYFSVEGKNDVKLSQTYIRMNQFNATNRYQDFSFITEFKGTFDKNMKLKVSVGVLPQSATTTINLDNIVVNRAYSSFTGIDTTLY